MRSCCARSASAASPRAKRLRPRLRRNRDPKGSAYLRAPLRVAANRTTNNTQIPPLLPGAAIMPLDLPPEQTAAGKANFEQATGELARAGKMETMVTGGEKPDPKNPDRRDLLKAGLAAGAVV